MISLTAYHLGVLLLLGVFLVVIATSISYRVFRLAILAWLLHRGRRGGERGGSDGGGN